VVEIMAAPCAETVRTGVATGRCLVLQPAMLQSAGICYNRWRYFATTSSIVKSATTNGSTRRSCIRDAKMLRLAIFLLEPAKRWPQASTRRSCMHDGFLFAICYNRCFGWLEPAPIFATTAVSALMEECPILHFCYQWRFGLLEPTSIFATIAVSVFARASPYFAFLLPLFLVLLEPAQKFATTAISCEPWRRRH
jgi:hypothetical protein